MVRILTETDISGASTRKQQQLLGRYVCQHAFRQLIGIGATRFQKLRSAALGQTSLPQDGRKRPRRDDGTNSESVRKRGLVVDFLEELYNCVSEPMPEGNQTVDEAGLHPGDKSLYVMPQMKFRRNRGKMPGKKFREKQLKPLRGQPVRLLPPGSFTEYFGLLKAKFPQEKFSLKLMCSAPRLSTLILMFSPVIISTCSIVLCFGCQCWLTVDHCCHPTKK